MFNVGDKIRAKFFGENQYCTIVDRSKTQYYLEFTPELKVHSFSISFINDVFYLHEGSKLTLEDCM